MDPTHDDFGNPIPSVSEWFGGRQPAVSDGQRVAELEERVAFLELSAGHAINAIDKGDVADARIILADAIRDMFKE